MEMLTIKKKIWDKIGIENQDQRKVNLIYVPEKGYHDIFEV